MKNLKAIFAIAIVVVAFAACKNKPAEETTAPAETTPAAAAPAHADTAAAATMPADTTKK